MPIQISDRYSSTSFAKRQTGLLFNLPLPDADHEQLPEGISLCMIVKNEERFLAECLESVKGIVDEICIVDTGSTDRTVEIARSFGAKIEFHEWRKDFSWARNLALAMATRRWTLVLDADEELERESRGLLNSVRTTPAQDAVVYVNIVNLISDSAGAGTMSHRLIRLFPTNDALRYNGLIHETLSRTDSEAMHAVLSPITILHKGYTAEILTSREKNDRNQPLLKRAYEEDAEDSFALFNFGNAAICSGNIEVGIEVLERMLDTAKEVKLYFPLAYLMLGQAYCEQLGDPEKALDIFDKAIGQFPDDAGLIFCKGQVLVKLDRIEEARKHFDDALNLREVMARTVMTDEEIFEWKIYYAMAGTYEREKNWERAIESIDQALANKPDAYFLLRVKAGLFERLSSFYEAEVMFRQIAETDTQRGLLDLVNFLLRRSRFTDALAIVENQIAPAVNPALIARLNVAAAQALLDSQRGDPMPYLEAALRYSPGNGQAIALMERVLTQRGDVDALLKLHTEELLAPCQRAEDFARRSYRLLAIERPEDALAAADAGLQIDPSNAELRFNSAIASLNLGDEERAARELARVEPDAPVAVVSETMRLLGALQLKAGDASAALASLLRYVASVPGNSDAILNSAQMLAGSGARAQARELLEVHAGVDPRIALELARMMLQDGDIEGAGRVAAASLT